MEEGTENKEKVVETPAPFTKTGKPDAASFLAHITGAPVELAQEYLKEGSKEVSTEEKKEEEKAPVEKKVEVKKVETKVEKEEAESEEEEESEEEQEQEEEGEDGKKVAKKDEKKVEKTPAKGAKDNEDTDEEEESVFFGKKKSKQPEVKIEGFEQVAAVSKKVVGFEVKDFKDMPKLFAAVEKLRIDAQEGAEHKKKADGLTEILENLPENLLDSIKAYVAGEDYMKPFTEAPKFDFNKPVEKQDNKELVNHFFPNTFKDEDFTEETLSQAIEIAIQASKDKFITMKQSYDDKRAAMIDQERVKSAARRTSIDGSVNHLKEQFPDLSPKALSEVRGVLEGDGIVGLFYNKDGSYTSQAAERIMLAIHGKSEMERLVKATAYKVESDTNEEIVTRAAEKKKQRSGSGGDNKVSDKANEFLANTVGGLGKKPTY